MFVSELDTVHHPVAVERTVVSFIVASGMPKNKEGTDGQGERGISNGPVGIERGWRWDCCPKSDQKDLKGHLDCIHGTVFGSRTARALYPFEIPPRSSDSRSFPPSNT